MGISVSCFQCLPIMNKAATNIHVHVFLWRSGVLGHRSVQLYEKLQTNAECSCFFTLTELSAPHPYKSAFLRLITFIDFSAPSGGVVVFHFPGNKREHFFRCLQIVCKSSSIKELMK